MPGESRALRWEPDNQLIAAVRCGSGSRKMSDLDAPDRSWVVAGLTLAGMTAEDIRDRLSCSLRSVRAIRAEPMTQVCLILQRETLNFGNESALSHSDLRACQRDLAAMTADRDRIKAQLDRVLDARLIGAPVDACGQGHLMTDWNVYWSRGRRWCRECHAQRQRDYRLAKRLGVPAATIRSARLAGELESVLQGASTVS